MSIWYGKRVKYKNSIYILNSYDKDGLDLVAKEIQWRNPQGIIEPYLVLLGHEESMEIINLFKKRKLK